MSKLKYWFLETRPQFLILSLVLAFLGTAAAWYNGYNVNIWYAVLAGVGLTLTHASVNILNDYFDFRSGVDLAVKRTPFSGGSGILPAKLLKPRQVLWLGIGCFVLAVPIGIFFIIVLNDGWQLLPLLLIAAFLIVLYSPFVLKRPWPEWSAGVGLGALPILGMYFVQAQAYTWDAVIACIPAALLVHNLLLLNEFPDLEADKVANRQTMPIAIGLKGSAVFFSAATIATYVWIILWVILHQCGVNHGFSAWTLLGLLTFPLALRAMRGSFHAGDPAKFMPGMAANVLTVLGTQFLIALGFILARVI
jgi:1,4-dihydroxy-2-naphthoate octaprenyltransferase